MTQLVGNPFPLFLDRRGRPLDGGRVYIGVAGQDPETSPIDAYFDPDGNASAPQPVSVVGGLISNAGNPALLFAAQDQFSLRVRDADGIEVLYLANAMIGQASYQPLDSDLTAISALSTTNFGRQLLALANAADARSYLGVVAPLPIAGGQVTGNITRQGAGGFAYSGDPAYPQIRLFLTANGAPDPRTQVGDIWLEAAP